MATSNNYLVYGGERSRPGSIDFAAARAVPISSVIGATIPLRRAGRDLVGRCPFHDEKSPSFTVNDEKGFAHCFGGGCGWHGDAVDYIMAVHNVDAREAVAMITGGALPVIDQRPALARTEPERETSAEAIELWQSASPAVGTLAEAYVRHRGIDIALPDTIRFARLRYGRRGPLYPVLVALITDVGNRPMGIQRTYLAADGRGKADVPKAKLSLGRVTGGAIRLGPDGTKVVVTEGLEDGLTLLAGLELPVWAAAGCGNLPTMRFPSEVREIVIGSDNDPSGQAEAAKAAERHASAGLAVRIIRPAATYKDFNDELMGDRQHG
jgi:DNA primase